MWVIILHLICKRFLYVIFFLSILKFFFKNVCTYEHKIFMHNYTFNLPKYVERTENKYL